MGAKAKIYQQKIIDTLKPIYGFKNVNEYPKLEKVVVNMGIGAESSDAKLVDLAFREVEAITGQKPVLTRAKKAIASFKVRENQPIGVMVTLRGEKMWNFLENLINIALPRVRDFKGLPTNSFDQQGNYTMGIKEQIIFPEINFDEVKRVHGFNITFVTSTNKADVARHMLKAIGLPIIIK